jgi:predicted CXXCH cytochrome family protein
VAALSLGCNPTARHKALTIFFDGVPPPKAAEPPLATTPTPAVDRPTSRRVGYREHGPYAAKLCGACHDSASTNALVVPRDELCFRCHELEQDVKYVHGPLASGGCLVCHDPHSSKFAFLLVSESDGFCLGCHDRAALAPIEGHGDPESNCTNCHDAHGSDTKYLLK